MIGAAQGASNNLGITGKTINRRNQGKIGGVAVDAAQALRASAYELQRTASSVLHNATLPMQEQHRTCFCHRGIMRPDGKASVYRRVNGAGSRLVGVTTCKSVWACPICSTKICALRQRELAEGMKAWLDQGGYVFLMTLTFPHEAGMALAELLEKFTKAKAHFKNSKTYKRILAKGIRKGSVTSLEVTLGEHGWHPHQHDLVFATPEAFGTVKEQGKKLASRLIDELKEQWYMSLRKAGLCEQHQMSDVLAHGLDIRGGQYAAEYVAKFGKEQKWGMSREVTMHASKVGSDNKGAHPFQLLAWAAEGDGMAAIQFREYVDAFDGKRMLSWSKGLKKELTGLDEMTDEEAADAELPAEEMVAAIDSEQLALLQSRRMLGNFLAFVSQYCGNPDTRESDIAAYFNLVRTIPPSARGTLKLKMHARGFMHVDPLETV